MNRETLKALKGSIRKWEKIVDGTGVDRGVDNCPLCNLFFFNDDEKADDCTGCPVAKAGAPNCSNTPYSEWHKNAFPNEGNGLVIADNDSAIAAVLELEWLRSLLPGVK